MNLYIKFFSFTFFIATNFVFSQIVSYELVKSWTKSEVEELYINNFLPSNTGEVNFEVDGYKILYFTPNHNGDLVLCSGAVYLPKGTICPSPVLSWQHGTTANDYWVPSNIYSDNNIIGVVGASHGYIVTMSDFIGLGDGVGFHNYVHAKTEASSTIDLILFGKEFAYDKGVMPNNQLFLFGYSQGGHATMATVRELQNNPTLNLNVTASAPMAGPYSMSGIMRELMESGMPYPNPGYLPYVLFSYQNIYNLFDDITEVLKYPYNEYLFGMYSGAYSMYEINQTLPQNPIEIFQDDYYENFLNDPNHPFNLALIDNDVYDFFPESPMKLFHCNGDDNIPFENSEFVYDLWTEYSNILGVELDVVLEDGGNFDHVTCAQFAIIGSKLWIDTMAEICEPEATTNLEQNLMNEKKIVSIYDLMGREIKPSKKMNQTLVYFYNDGTFEKRFPLFETEMQR